MNAKPRKPLLVNLSCLAGLLLLLYPLCYAPVLRFWGGTTYTDDPVWESFLPQVDYADGRRYPPFRPIDWLIDHTPLRHPLFWWAGLWGVRDDFESSRQERTIMARLRALP
jgi:hypothetical protein